MEITTEKTYCLYLTAEEARWLMDYMQNQKIEIETDNDKIIRKRFFNNLKDEGL